MKSSTILRSSLSLLLLAFVLGMTGESNRFLTAMSDVGTTLSRPGTVQATGPAEGAALEDRVEIMWTVETPIDLDHSFHIKRDGALIRIAAPSVSIYEDKTAVPAVTYSYCVYVVDTAGVEDQIGTCDVGGRLIAPPTGFDATKGTNEDFVLLTWSDRSEIEGGFNIYREGGNAIEFDGNNDFISTPGTTTLDGSFTFEFWAKRGSTNSDDFIVNIEKNPNGDPVNVDLEVGFVANGKFQFRFGANSILETPLSYNDQNWHHWAIAYDSPNRRRFIYSDGFRVAMDVLSETFRPSGFLEFARRDKQGSGNNRGHYDGQLDEIRYWNVALTEAQVATGMSTLRTGFEQGLVSSWPMDVASGLSAPDVQGDLPGTLVNMNANSWVVSGIPGYYAQVGADLTSYADRAAVPGFQSYTYTIAAFEDFNNDGVYTTISDYESLINPQFHSDFGWRGNLTPPGNVSATDGQYSDRVVVSWNDRSDSEDSYRVYRNNALVGTVGADEVEFTYLTGATSVDNYCVAGVGGGVESVQGCDEGRAGGLSRPEDVAATNGLYDDRIAVTWVDPSATENGFEVFRDNILLATVAADVEEYSDVSAVQGTAYNYCVGAFSDADPLSPVRSDTTCAPAAGLRATVLDPTNLTASKGDFEDRVELSWSNPSTTAMLFMVYANNVLIQVLDYNMTTTIDIEIASDADVNYCVSAATVTTANAVIMQGRVAQVLDTISMEDAVSRTTGEAPATLESKLTAVRAVFGQTASSTNVLGIEGLVESGQICDIGSRSLLPPTDVVATDNGFESHVEVSWSDNSSFESGYNIFRSGTAAPIAEISANRTTYEDYTGTPGMKFDYTVQALDARGISTSATDSGLRTLEPPTALTASDGTSESEVALDWKDNSSAEVGYRIYRRDAGIDPYVEIAVTGKNEPAYADMAFADNEMAKTFDYKVVAYDLYGESLAATNPGRTMLEKPANVNASDVYDDKVVVVWVDRSEVEDSYVLTRRPYESAGGTATTIATVLTGQPTTFVDVSGGAERYEYCVVAQLNSGVSSDPVCDLGKQFTIDGGGGGTTTGSEAVKITAAPHATNNNAEGVRFGASVAISGTNAIIGSPGGNPFVVSGLKLYFNSNGQGQAFPFVGINPTTNDWGMDAPLPLTPPQGLFGAWQGAEYGRSVDISNNYMVVGDPHNDNDGNGVFVVYRRDGNNWNQIRRHGNGGGMVNTGYSVALTNEFVAIGDNQFSTTKSGHGQVTICDAVNQGDCDRGQDIPKLENLIPTNEQAVDAGFGSAVDIMRDGNDLFVIAGAPGDDKAHIFTCNIVNTQVLSPPSPPQDAKAGCSVTSDWSKVVTLDSRFAPGSGFGEAVAINRNIAVVGAPGAKGIAVYQRTGADWPEVQATSRADDAGFGAAIALLDNVILVGAPFANVAGIDSAGTMYVFDFDPGTTETNERVQYDARAGGEVLEFAHFGASVAFDGINYLVGAPGDDGATEGAGAAYSIPVGFEPPKTAVIPRGVDLVTPGRIRASDGTAADRIQIRWDDESEDEDGHIVYRGNDDGTFDRLAEVTPNIEFFDDFDAAPGEAYNYCVAAYFGGSETDQSCDIGWRPPNGTISGRIAEQLGNGTEGATVCIAPDPNKSLLFDGGGGFLEAPVGEELSLDANFSIEAWIRPHDVLGTQYIVAKEDDWGLSLVGNKLQFSLFRDAGGDDILDTRDIVAGEWTHVAASFRREAPTNDVTLFINGVAGPPEVVLNLAKLAGDTLTIGHRGDRIDPISATFFEGEIDELRIWNGPRTESQITPLMMVPLTGEEENLLGYWPLDQGNRFVAPDLSASANHVKLIDGVYLADQGTKLEVCTVTGDDGNYAISGIRYGEMQEFNVIPTRPGREFSPSFKKITLAVETPVQNEIFFTDITAYGVSGLVQFVDVVGTETFTCAVPDVVMHASKGNVASDDNVKNKTRADGSFAVSVDPSIDDTDTWFFIPTYVDLSNGGVIHEFQPEYIESPVNAPKSGVNFNDLTRYSLTGNFTGGDPATCHKNIGVARIRLYTQDGCYNREFTVNSAALNGEFPDLDLPPLKYLMEVVEITNPGDLIPQERFDDIKKFFTDLGAVEVDMTKGPLERSLIYRAPLTLRIVGLEEGVNSCVATGIIQKDEDGNPLRTLPDVKVIPEFGFQPLSIEVMEDYGNGELCGVETGTVTIFDAIADRVDADSTVALTDGVVDYSTFGASPNIFSGARIQGVDRSFQKPLTVVAQVEGRKTLVNTEWALVLGARERSSTFVSATTEEFPLLILHDPPGSNSYAFIEEGNKMCTTISNTKLTGGGAGLDLDVMIGFKAGVGFSFGAHFDLEGGAGFYITTRTTFGRDNTELDGENIEICLTTTERLNTSNDMTWVGEDIFMGVALNLIFAIADQLELENSCSLTLNEILATDLDNAEPFETTYMYGASHIALSLIPELENLIRIGGDATVSGEINEVKTTVRLEEAVQNWKDHLKLNENLISDGISASTENRSFSGGTEFSHVETADTTRVTDLESRRIYFNSETSTGLIASIGYDQKIGIAFDIRSEWNYEKKSTEGTSQSIGYVLSDGDTGDYFSVDIGDDPRYHTKVFETKSGRSSNPWEGNTQKRDNPIITVDPPVMFDVDPELGAHFELTLINGSESNERRQYTMAVPGETNPFNLGLTVTGDLLGGQRLETFLLDPGKAITINMDALRVSPPFAYRDVGVMLYPATEMAIWLADPRADFALSDTAFFSVFYDSTGGNVLTSVLAEGWNWVSINRPADQVDSVFKRVQFAHGDLLRNQKSYSEYDSTRGWVGDIDEIMPGQGYRLKVQNPGFLRMTGEAIESEQAIQLTPGWNWVGYMPTRRAHLGEALASLGKKVIAGDAVVGQDGFAQYVNGVGWVGTLTEMNPGESYAIYLTSEAELLYPLEPTNEDAPDIAPRETTVRGPEWEVVSEEFTTSMTVVAEIQMSNVPLEQTTTKIAVFEDDVIRGVGEVHYVKALDKHLAFIQIYGEFDEEAEMVVHVYDGEEDVLYEAVATISYEAQKMIGQPAQPVMLDLAMAGLAPELLDLPELIALHPNYPNPFRETSTIGYDLPEAAVVQIGVYDLLGRRVVMLVDGEQAAGRHKAVFDAKRLASGIYFYRMDAGDFREVGKMIIVK